MRAAKRTTSPRPSFISFKKPKSADAFETVDLINKQKIEELRSWLRNRKSGVLILSGPTGCGKTVVLRDLCNELGISILEQDSVGRVSTLSRSFEQPNEFDQFCQFIQQSTRLSTNKLFGSAGPRLVLVEEIPTACRRDPPRLHELLELIQPTLRCILVFALSTKDRGDKQATNIFPADLIARLNVHQIRFNAITEQRVVRLLRSKMNIDTDTLKGLYKTNDGNFKAMLNDIQFTGTRHTNVNMKRDGEVSIFRWIGKVLYRKVTMDPGAVDEESVQELVHASPFPAVNVVSLLDYNFAAFVTDVEDCQLMTEHISWYDEMSSHLWMADQNDKLGMSDLPLQVAIGSFLLTKPIDRSSYKWVPLKGPPKFDSALAAEAEF